MFSVDPFTISPVQTDSRISLQSTVYLLILTVLKPLQRMIMDFVTKLLGSLAYEFTLLQPLLPTYFHLISSAVFSIFIGTHASLTRPTSAAEPTQPQKGVQDDDDREGSTEQKMEGLSPIDALTFPVFAGCTLAGLYFLLKWLDDPALLNKILNFYFSIFGMIAVIRLVSDSMGIIISFVFPSAYTAAGKVWRADQRQRKMISLELPPAEKASPFPGWLSRLNMPQDLTERLWSLRDILTAKLRVRIYVYEVFSTKFRVSTSDVTGLLAAILSLGYYNFVDKLWWLTNLLGISFAYNAMQLMSPSTFWTGTMILSALFLYDIYFVFYTPLMVTVATKIDIPAKLLFPRPSGSDDTHTQAFSMLGLGDIVLPGIMMGLALRFDLYLFYLRKQHRRDTAPEKLLENKGDDCNIVKAEWLSATGSWGERFWIGRRKRNLGLKEQGGVFPKTYFYASVLGYLAGLTITLGIMHSYKHAQPALLYLVPGVLGALWGTALFKGDVKLMWEYDEAIDEKEKKSIFSPSRLDEIASKLEPATKKADLSDDPENSTNEGNSGGSAAKGPSNNDRHNELIHFSISLPNAKVRNVGQDRSSKDEGPERQEEDGKPAAQPASKDMPHLLSKDDRGPSHISTSLSFHTQANMDQGQEPSGKRQRIT